MSQANSTVSVNYLGADYLGGIAYVRGGRAPVRAAHATGVLPLPAWDTANHWLGLTHAHTALVNKEDRFVTANNELYFGEAQRVVGFHMGEYRAHRAHHLLHELERRGPQLTVEDMKEMQCDTFSEQADLLLGGIHVVVSAAKGEAAAELTKRIKNSQAYRVLSSWDRLYDPDSIGAPIFETVYDDLLENIVVVDLFGGSSAWPQIRRSPLKMHFFHHLDHYLQQVMETAPERVLAVLADSFAKLDAAAGAKSASDGQQQVAGRWAKWSEQSNMVMTNVFLNGALPLWTGFDHGPVPVAGGRGTLVQGQVRTHASCCCSFDGVRI